ncbi:MAG: DeoR family transcriptional regulator [Desulfobacteraceae bacterium]
MTTNKDERLQTIKELIEKKKVLSFDKIEQSVNVSGITVRRDLLALNYITSYTHRGRFITLPKIPCFDNNGIWFFHEIGFSQYGNSLDSILKLIDQSKQGVSREDLEDILKIGISKQIQILIGQEKLNRVKLGGKYIYIPEDLMKNGKKKYRLIGKHQTEDYFEKDVRKKDLILLLKAVLEHNGIKMANLKQIVKKYNLKLPIKKIEKLLTENQLTEKKKP